MPGLANLYTYYNSERLHSRIDYLTPMKYLMIWSI